jgi:ATP-dependent DNA helicase RecG
LATRKLPTEPSLLFRLSSSGAAQPVIAPKPLPAPPAISATPRAPVRIEDRDIALAEGIGPKRAEALRSREIATLGDAALHLPYRYKDLRRRDRIADLHPGIDAIIEGQLENFKQRPLRSARIRSLASAVMRDREKRVIDVTWFNLPSYVRFPVNQPILLSGRISLGTRGKLQMVHPEVYRSADAMAPLEPVYSLPSEVPQRLFTGVVQQILKVLPDDALAALPPLLRAEAKLPGYREALSYLHRPPADADLEQLAEGTTVAQQSLAIDEMFAFQLALAREKQRGERRAGVVLPARSQAAAEFLDRLPFRPTAAQLKAIDEIEGDLARPVQMNRMLIGDVGSGKTLVAFHSLISAVGAGCQAVMMAPTQLLAEQHYRNFLRMTASTTVMSTLLTAKVIGAERLRLLRAIERGDIAVIFGTQALIQQEMKVKRLGVAVIDEQHRFGVFERARLKGLGADTNVLSMTATPIPRSLALMLFRNLEVSILDEMPPGRTPVATRVIAEPDREEADKLVLHELEHGYRAYYVAPTIDAADDQASTVGLAFARPYAREAASVASTESVMATAKRLGDGVLKGRRIGILHGRMRPAEKDCVMREFRDGALEVLVATTVVEVGIDVPEATIMVVIAAERYGLAQLHQLRGRVGRGEAASQCLLIASASADSEALERLEILARTTSGAEVAHEDLRLRGPGDLLGARQTGALPLRFAELIRDAGLIERAGELADEWMRRDPRLESRDSAGARLALERMLKFGFSLGDVG